MIKSTVTLAFMVTVFSASLMKAQDFQGQATYESKTIIKDDIKIDGPNMTPDMKAMFAEKMKKAFEKTYVLNFNKTESIYEEPQKLEAPDASSGGVVIKTASASDGKIYKNIKSKMMLSEEDFFGKEFLITDSLPNWNWQLMNETKKIGNYTCYKAVSVIPVTKEDMEEYEKMKKKKSEGATQLFTVSEPKERTITVWYTPEIPISQGPGEYWGLPGLIMEVNDATTVVLCSKIVLNPKDKITIKVPKSGKKVTKKEYDILIEKQMEQMKDSKGNIQIRIGN
ncbi:GLPGLI family protein [Flavobacterium gossypii]|uniref:GLPGLI family protein n=1 Tax=Flavobacterium gossypii TaxID=1646119 RepID=A0ABR6DQ31_9FLAO|nr:GLPGLI family protein [Flavobacterium gossypii]MBA9073797.1 GLPGLI family protein [Flavobacterium gossypii]